jgi:CO dehydrogenase maturation factor
MDKKHSLKPTVVAFAGKGGVGKTTMGGMLVRYLAEELKNGPILAVDADPNSNLNEVLGVKVASTIGEAREGIKKDVPAGMTKDVWFEYKVHEAIVEGPGFDLLVMGRPEGPGCYCAANSLAKSAIDALKDNYAYVVVDNEAGMEHMSRLVTQDVDHLYVVSDGGPRGLLTAARVLAIIGELRLNIRHTHPVINRVNEENRESLKQLAADKGIHVAGVVREDGELARADSVGETVFSLRKNSLALSDAYDIFRRTLNF